MNRLFVQHLTVIDFSYLDAHRGVVGESWIVDIELGGELDEQGMVFDFAHVKKVIKAGIDEAVDHKLLVPSQMESLQVQDHGEEVELQLTLASGAGQILHRSPQQAIALLPFASLTRDQLAPYLAARLKQLLPDNVADIRLRLREEIIQDAYYHYSHGLKKHRGNCQRIAHGHRSRIEILRDGQRDTALEHDWARSWQDIYIGTHEDLAGQPEIDGKEHLEFRYRADQGDFYICLPKPCVYMMETDSTVELIAQHIADCLAQRHPDSHIEVRAYEGVDKGAIAERGRLS